MIQPIKEPVYDERRAIGTHELIEHDMYMLGWESEGLMLFSHCGKIYDFAPVENQLKYGINSILLRVLIEMGNVKEL